LNHTFKTLTPPPPGNLPRLHFARRNRRNLWGAEGVPLTPPAIEKSGLPSLPHVAMRRLCRPPSIRAEAAGARRPKGWAIPLPIFRLHPRIPGSPPGKRYGEAIRALADLGRAKWTTRKPKKSR
jgi:hypothetical protein